MSGIDRTRGCGSLAAGLCSLCNDYHIYIYVVLEYPLSLDSGAGLRGLTKMMMNDNG